MARRKEVQGDTNMLTKIKALFSPPVFEDDEVKTRNALLITILVRTGMGLAVIMLLPLLLITADPLTRWVNVALVGFFLAISAVILVVLQQERVKLASILLLLAFFIIFSGALYGFGGLSNPVTGGFLVVIFLASLLLGQWGTFAFGGLSALVVTGVHLLDQSGALPQAFTDAGALPVFLGILFIMSVSGGFIQRVINITTERLECADRILRERNQTLEESRDAFQKQARDLEHRARSLETVAGVARDAISSLNMESLLVRVVTLLSQRLDFYHTGLFLLDETHESLILRAASSVEGKRLLRRGYDLSVNVDAIVETVALRGESYVIDDIREKAVEDDEFTLPQTQSEILLPLSARGEIIGMLDVQSKETHAFDQETVSVFEILSDQIAVAISNARLYEQAQQSLEAERRAYRELSSDAWAQLMEEKLVKGFTYERGDVRSLAKETDDQPSAVSDDELPTLSLPIKIRGQFIGTLVAHKSEDDLNWTVEEKALMTTLVEQLAATLESARLYEDTQRRVAREQIVGKVAGRMRESLDMETVMQTALQEIGDALDISKIKLRMRDVENL